MWWRSWKLLCRHMSLRTERGVTSADGWTDGRRQTCWRCTLKTHTSKPLSFFCYRCSCLHLASGRALICSASVSRRAHTRRRLCLWSWRWSRLAAAPHTAPGLHIYQLVISWPFAHFACLGRHRCGFPSTRFLHHLAPCPLSLVATQTSERGFGPRTQSSDNDVIRWLLGASTGRRGEPVTSRFCIHGPCAVPAPSLSRLCAFTAPSLVVIITTPLIKITSLALRNFIWWGYPKSCRCAWRPITSFSFFSHHRLCPLTCLFKQLAPHFTFSNEKRPLNLGASSVISDIG